VSIIVDKRSRVLVQGITGNEGSFHTRQMLRYGTNVVAGVTPGKGGQVVEGVPVYDHVADAAAREGANVSIVFVPARSARAAMMESLDAGIRTIVAITESIPLRDTMELIAHARTKSAVIVGPNTAGVLDPSSRTLVGIMPTHIFSPGPVGIASRSGTLTYEVAWHITSGGPGQSTCVGIGGDPMRGLDFVDVLEMFRRDDDTEAVVLIGEIGGNAEESAARYVVETAYPKPVVAYVAGRMAPPEKRMGHAGAIIMGGAGSADGKIEAFRKAGIGFAEKPSDVPALLRAAPR